ncbi:MAG: tyrosine-type recombinase/integrase [Actinomycetota bacterium]
MIVHKVVMPTTAAVSYTVLGHDLAPVEPAERYLAHLSGIERSPNTVRAYAYGLKLRLEFLALHRVDWDAAGVEDVSRFVSWLRSPDANVIVLDADASQRSAATVNRHLAAVFGFYDFHARSGVALAASLVAWRRVSRGSYKPFLHHVTKGKSIPTRPIKLKVAKRIPPTLADDQLRAILEACERLRDRFLLALLIETGMRVGQALGLRHADFSSRSREVTILPRADNANGARAKCSKASVIPVSTGVVRLYSDYMHTEYGTLDSDYVFLNLFAEPRGRPLRYQAVAGLVTRIRKRTGVPFTLHTLRHTRATNLIRDGVAIEVVSKLLTHSSVATTSQAYVHLEAEDLRSQLVRVGAWGKNEDAL